MKKIFIIVSIFILFQTLFSYEINIDKILFLEKSEISQKIDEINKTTNINETNESLYNILLLNSEKIEQNYLAKKYVEKIMSQYFLCKNKSEKMTYNFLLGEYFLVKKNYDKSLEYFNNVDFDADILNLRYAKLYFLKNDFEKANNYLKKIKNKENKKYNKIFIEINYNLKQYFKVEEEFIKFRNRDLSCYYYDSLYNLDKIDLLKEEIRKDKKTYFKIYFLEKEGKYVLAIINYVKLSLLRYVNLSYMILSLIVLFLILNCRKNTNFIKVIKKILFFFSLYLFFGIITNGIINFFTQGSLVGSLFNKTININNILISQMFLNFLLIYIIITQNKIIFKRFLFKDFIRGIYIFILSIISFYSINYLLFPIIKLIEKRFSQNEINSIDLLKNIENKNMFFLFVILAVIFAPILEEIIFRKFLYTFLKENTINKHIAMVLTSLIFAVLHESIGNLISLFVLGYILVLFYDKTKRLYPVIIAHGLINFYMIFTFYIFYN